VAGFEITICDLKSWPGRSPLLPYAFTEQGVAMLSSVLASERAIAVNIEIMRAFVRMRELLSSNRELARRFAQLEARIDKNSPSTMRPSPPYSRRSVS
jgi:hypothetical protein